MITGFLLGGALLTKSPALFFSILLPLAVVLVKGKKRVLKFVLLLIPTYLIAYAIYNLLRLGPNFHLLAQRNLDYVYPLTHLLISPLDPFNPFLDRIRQYFVILGPWPILILPLLGIAFNFKKFTKELFLIAAWFLFPILVSAEFSKTMTARYVLSSLPFLMVLAGAAMEGAKNLKLRVGVWLLILVSLIQSLFLVGKLLTKPESANLPRSERSGYLEEWTAGTGIKEAAAFFKTQTENLPPGKQVVVGTEGYFGTLPDGLQIYLNNYPRLTVIGVGLNFDKVPSPLVDSAKSGNKTYLLVNASRFDGNAEALGLNLRETFPKAVKPDGTHDTLNLFEVTPNEIKQVKP
jgi:hypothetical protein